MAIIQEEPPTHIDLTHDLDITAVRCLLIMKKDNNVIVISLIRARLMHWIGYCLNHLIVKKPFINLMH